MKSYRVEKMSQERVEEIHRSLERVIEFKEKYPLYFELEKFLEVNQPKEREKYLNLYINNVEKIKNLEKAFEGIKDKYINPPQELSSLSTTIEKIKTVNAYKINAIMDLIHLEKNDKEIVSFAHQLNYELTKTNVAISFFSSKTQELKDMGLSENKISLLVIKNRTIAFHLCKFKLINDKSNIEQVERINSSITTIIEKFTFKPNLEFNYFLVNRSVIYETFDSFKSFAPHVENEVNEIQSLITSEIDSLSSMISKNKKFLDNVQKLQTLIPKHKSFQEKIEQYKLLLLDLSQLEKTAKENFVIDQSTRSLYTNVLETMKNLRKQ